MPEIRFTKKPNFPFKEHKIPSVGDEIRFEKN